MLTISTAPIRRTTTHPVFGGASAPTIPDYIVVDTKGFKGGVTADSPEADPSRYSIADYGNIHQILKTSPGTNWFKSVIQPGIIQSHQISASGSTEKSTYSLGFAISTRRCFQIHRFQTLYRACKHHVQSQEFIRVGENLQVSTKIAGVTTTKVKAVPGHSLTVWCRTFLYTISTVAGVVTA